MKNFQDFIFNCLPILILLLIIPVLGCEQDFKVKLATNSWLTSNLDALIAQRIIEQELGYPTEVVEMDEHLMWQLIAKGEFHACLEVWPSGHADNVKKYVEQDRSVEILGLLGVVGKISWFVPGYVIEDHPALIDWISLKDPGLASVFNPQGNNQKGYFLAGDASWTQHDRDIIRNLDLHLQVKTLGSEEALIKAVEEAALERRPVLLYFWHPHSLIAQYDMREIKLPPYSDRCYSGAAHGLVDCDYPPAIIFKIGWPGLKKRAPEAYHLLENFNLNDEDHNALLAMVGVDKLTPQQAADKWLKENRARWINWIAN